MVRCHLAGGAGTVAAIPRKPTGLGVRLSYDRQRGRPSERAAHFARGSWSTQAMARSTRTLVQTSCGPAASPHGKDQLPRYGKYSAAAYVPIDGSPSHVTHGDHGDVVRHVPPSLRSQAHVAQRSMSRARKATRPVRHRTRRMPPGSATPMIRHRALIEPVGYNLRLRSPYTYVGTRVGGFPALALAGDGSAHPAGLAPILKRSLARS